MLSGNENKSQEIEMISNQLVPENHLLRKIEAAIKGKGATFISLKENIDTSTPQEKFMLTVFAALTELEVDCIKERQMEGIAIAKSEGKYHGRKPMRIDEDKFKSMCKQWRDGKRTAVSVMREFNISATTFYKFVDQRGL